MYAYGLSLFHLFDFKKLHLATLVAKWRFRALSLLEVFQIRIKATTSEIDFHGFFSQLILKINKFHLFVQFGQLILIILIFIRRFG